MSKLHFDRKVMRGSKPSEYFGFKASKYEQAQIKAHPKTPRLYLGIEIEAELKAAVRKKGVSMEAAVKKVYEALNGFVVIINDGTLDDGMEIVTTPATFDYHMGGVWEKFFAENNGPAKLLWAWGTERAGVHIHVSSNYFTAAHAAKLAHFINASDNLEHLVKFSGRNNRWAPYVPGVTLVSFTQGNFGGRGALNFSKDGTIEFRLFRGNVSRSGIYRYIQFVQALCEFTRYASFKRLAWHDFCEYATKGSNSKRFKYLRAWLIKNHYAVGRPSSTINLDDPDNT